MDGNVTDILSVAEAGRGITSESVEYLLSLDEASEEARLMQQAAIKLGKQLTDGEGFIHAQIGVDSHACDENCRFCSFASVNTPDPHDFFEIDTDYLCQLVALFSDEGVNLVSLMATAGLEFDTLVGFVTQARAAMNDNTVLLVNGPDFTLEQTRTLRRAGAQAAYHALRLGEGIITDIAPEQRLRTMDNIHAAGLALMTGVEPVWQGVDVQQLAQRIQLIPTLHPLWMGACKLAATQGTAMQHARPASRARVDQVGAVARLAAGSQAPIGGVGGVIWVDAGADPRCRGKREEAARLKSDIAAARSTLEQRRWRVASPSSSLQRVRQAVS